MNPHVTTTARFDVETFSVYGQKFVADVSDVRLSGMAFVVNASATTPEIAFVYESTLYSPDGEINRWQFVGRDRNEVPYTAIIAND